LSFNSSRPNEPRRIFHKAPFDEKVSTGGEAMNINLVSKWLSAGASLAVIIGVCVAIGGFAVALRTLTQSQQIASADLALKLRATLDAAKFAKLVADIQNHDHASPLLARSEGGRGGKFRDLDIEQYISVFEDIGYLIEDDLIITKMAYDEFSYDFEKAWCNADVQRVVGDARKADKSSTRQTDPIYGHFEKLARSYLAREGETCKDLDNQ
jgi:hypothetical protein